MFHTSRTAKNFVNVSWWLFVDLRVSVVCFVHPRIFLSFPSFVYFYFYNFFSFHFFLFFFLHFFEILGKHAHSLRNKMTEILSNNSEGKSRYIDQ